MPQLGEGFIDRIIDLTKQEADLEYRQNLVDRQIVEKNKAIKAASKRQEIVNLIKRLEERQGTGATSDSFSRDEITARLDKAITQLNRFGIIAGGLFETLGNKRISNNGRLYVAQKLSRNAAYSSYHPVFNTNIYSILFLATLAAAVFAMFAGLIQQMMRGRSSLS